MYAVEIRFGVGWDDQLGWFEKEQSDQAARDYESD
jgi:hypothetical protein